MWQYATEVGITADRTDWTQQYRPTVLMAAHLFECPTKPTELTPRSLWEAPTDAAEFLSLEDDPGGGDG